MVAAGLTPGHTVKKEVITFNIDFILGTNFKFFYLNSSLGDLTWPDSFFLQTSCGIANSGFRIPSIDSPKNKLLYLFACVVMKAGFSF